MNLHQELSFNLDPDQADALLKIFLLGVGSLALLLSIFFSAKTFLSLTAPLPASAGSQILNITQINKAAELISQKTAKFSVR